MINGYDFDETIYDGDSSVDFYFYCLKRNKRVLLQFPVQLWGLILYLFHIIDKNKFKERLFSYLKRVDDIDTYIKDFWKEKKKNIKKWYFNQHEKSDIIVSASPEFLLKPLEKELDVKIIGSVVDKKTGKFLKKNCHDYEKVKRFNKESKNKKLKAFYSDSMSDKPMMEIAKEAYLVKKNKITNITNKIK